MGTVSYRCVCGKTIPLDTVGGGKCAACGRHYAAEVLKQAFAETVRLAPADETGNVQAACDAAEQRAGETFGHYEIVSRLGQGGMGSVYRALDKSLQRYVALKVIHTGEQTVSDTQQLQRLFQEAIAQARVNHPNVAHIYYVGREGDVPFLAMELVDGQTLEDEAAGGPLPFERVIAVALQVVDALRHCVRFDILHGDIKPTNILLTSGGSVKLSDFGLAKRLSPETSDATGIGGTPNYMPPEAFTGSTTDVRSDMYSLGVTLFEVTFGRLPYSLAGGTLQEYVQAHRELPIEFPDPWPPEIPQGFRAVLEKLLAKTPDERYASYDELLAELRKSRPASFPKAGRVQRGLAWFVDVALANTALNILTFPFQDARVTEYLRPIPASILALLVAAVSPLLASALQAGWGTTPGKRIFQIRIVDRHGLLPSQATLAARMVFQLLPIWSSAVILGFELMGVPALGLLLSLAAGLIVIADAACAVLRRDGRSLHDFLFDTRVVLGVSSRRVPVDGQ